MKRFSTSRHNSLFIGLFALVLMLGACSSRVMAQGQKPIRVLTISGDWKSQAWYQDVWMQGKGEDGKGTAPVRYRGRFIASQVNKFAPGRFEFTDVTNYIGQQYGDADYFSQFDVVMMGDVVGWSMPPRLLDGLQRFVENGGGFLYAASYKWETALLDNTPFETVLPAKFGVDGYRDDWKNAKTRLDEENFKPVVAMPAHPIVAGLDWANVPTLDRGFRMQPKATAQVLLKTPQGAPLLAAWQMGKGRSAISASINANDEVSSKIGGWKDFGKYYTQMFAWLGANSPRRAVTLRDAVAEYVVGVNGGGHVAAGIPVALPNNSNGAASAKTFSIHASHDDPGLAPLQDEALKNFSALNLRGAFSRFSPQGGMEEKNDNDDPNTFNMAGFKFDNLDSQMVQMNRLGLEPILLLNDFYGNPSWLWENGSSWSNPTPKGIAEAAEMASAAIQHLNGGKKGDAGYKLNVRFLEIANEPDLNGKTIPGFARLFKGVAQRIHRDYPGVQVGTFGGYEIPYLPQFLQAVNPDMDWISRHPYGWTGERVFSEQDEVTAFMKQKGLRQIPFIITEWDFWIQGRPKFDYMMRRNFEAVKRDNLLGALHYRLGQYAEPVYMFGVLWAGWGKEKGAGEKGTPMHDAYDAFWLWRDFRGTRASVDKTVTTPNATRLGDHLLADAASEGQAMNTVLYFDWGHDGEGVKDMTRGVRYNKARVKVKINLTTSRSARTLTIGRATGEGFQIIGAPEKIAVGQSSIERVVELEPMTGLSLTVR